MAMNDVWSCGGDRLPSERAEKMPSVSSAERNAAFAEQEYELESETEAGECVLSEEEKEQERAVTPYENLEQPAELSDRREALLFKSQFIVSYDFSNLCPNYVCWSLTRDRLKGDAKRCEFRGDPAVGENGRVETMDYNRSGYDRGHMCPAADNKNSVKAMEESFFMTNVCPQSHNLNSGVWKQLEEFCRRWVGDYGTLYICCGPIFDSKEPKRIGKRKDLKVAVPDRFFKVILTLGRVPKAIGFIFPNEDCAGDISDYAVSVDKVEEITRMDFFYQLDDKQERELERVCNPAAWGL